MLGELGTSWGTWPMSWPVLGLGVLGPRPRSQAANLLFGSQMGEMGWAGGRSSTRSRMNVDRPSPVVAPALHARTRTLPCPPCHWILVLLIRLTSHRHPIPPAVAGQFVHPAERFEGGMDPNQRGLVEPMFLGVVCWRERGGERERERERKKEEKREVELARRGTTSVSLPPLPTARFLTSPVPSRSGARS